MVMTKGFQGGERQRQRQRKRKKPIHPAVGQPPRWHKNNVVTTYYVQTIEWQFKANNKVWVLIRAHYFRKDGIDYLFETVHQRWIHGGQHDRRKAILTISGAQSETEYRTNTNYANTNYAQTLVSQTAKLNVNYVLGVWRVSGRGGRRCGRVINTGSVGNGSTGTGGLGVCCIWAC